MAVVPDRAPAAVHGATARTSRSAVVAVGVAVLAAALWRLPSLFDPPWVNDEGTYFAVAQSMAHGFKLYVDVWENKPPALYLVYSAVYHLAGPSLLAVRLLAFMAALGCVVLTYLLACREAREWAPAASMTAGLILGVPFLEGTTANAEIFLALLSGLAVWLVLCARQPAAGGAVMALALFVKAVALFDATALGLWLLLWRRRQFRPFAVAYLAVVALALVTAWRAGILGAMLRDALLYDVGYVGHGNGGGVPWLLLLKAGVLVTFSVALRRAPFPPLWLLYTAAGTFVSGRLFGHYALQAVVPLVLSMAMLLRSRPPPSRILWMVPAAFAAGALVSACVGSLMAATGHDSITARRLQWYANAVRYACGFESGAWYDEQVDDHVSINRAVAARLNRVPTGRLLVWGNRPWIYVLSDRLPATPYTSSLRAPEVPGETPALQQAVRLGRPVAVVVIEPPAPALGEARRALGRLYRPMYHRGDATLYVRSSRRASASATASVSSGTR